MKRKTITTAFAIIWTVLTNLFYSAHAAFPGLAVSNGVAPENGVVLLSVSYSPSSSGFDPQPVSMRVKVNFDSTLLSVGQPMAGVALVEHTLYVKDPIMGSPLEIVITPKQRATPLQEGEIVRIPFAVTGKPTYVAGTQETAVTLSDVELSNGQPITISSANIGDGKITIVWRDTDGDGVPDHLDTFPTNSADASDNDGDGIGDNADPDDDNDGIPDAFDLQPFNAANANGDSDGDGLTDLQEYQRGLPPNNADYDGDGLPDGWEVKYGLDPFSKNEDPQDPNIHDGTRDLDGDTLTNYQEYLAGTDPNKVDSDNDNVNDDVELAQGRNPAVNEPAIMGIIQNLLLSD